MKIDNYRIQIVIMGDKKDSPNPRCLDSLKNQDIKTSINKYDPKGIISARLNSLNDIDSDIDFIAIIDGDDVVSDQFIHNILKYINDNNIVISSNVVLVPDERIVEVRNRKYVAINKYRHDLYQEFRLIRGNDIKVYPFDILHEPRLLQHFIVPTSLYIDFLIKLLPFKDILIENSIEEGLVFNYLHSLNHDIHFIKDAMYYHSIKKISNNKKEKWPLIHNDGFCLRKQLKIIHSIFKDERLDAYFDYGAICSEVI